MKTRFISEPIKPITGTIDTRSMSIGAPGLPGRFVWRDEEYTVESVISRWHEVGDCKHGSGEQYVRKHWFLIRATSGLEMKIYFERQAQSARERKLRWWLYTISLPETGESPDEGITPEQHED